MLICVWLWGRGKGEGEDGTYGLNPDSDSDSLCAVVAYSCSVYLGSPGPVRRAPLGVARDVDACVEAALEEATEPLTISASQSPRPPSAASTAV